MRPSLDGVSRRFLYACTLVALTAGCSTTTGTTNTTTTAGDAGGTTSTIEWEACDGNNDVSCATLDVPYDYDDPSIGTFTLALVKHSATDPSARIGSLLVNPGGPGFGGTYLAEDAASYFSGRLLEVFDIIGWDPRGTGSSTPAIDCIDDYDSYFTIDPTPETDQEKQRLVDASIAFADACEERSGEILPHVSTNNSARDIDSIRRALGERTISYFGFSYGSELGATWATLFPDTVRAAVLDGATDPGADYVQSGLDQARGFENEFSKFLEACATDRDCEFHNAGRPREAFIDLMATLDDDPLMVSDDRAPVNQAVLQTAVTTAMYSSSMWPVLEGALADAQRGDGAGLLDLFDDYYQRRLDGTYNDTLEAFLAISCLDDPGPQSVEEADSHTPTFVEVAPLLHPTFTGGYVCVFWSTQPDRRVPVTAEGAGQILVIGVTGDAATPLASTRNMAAALEDGRLIVVEANRHTGYGINACVTNATDDYLIGATVGFEEKLC